MKFTVLQENLKAALGVVGKAIGGKTTLPVLENVLLRVQGGVLHVEGTDLNIGITKMVAIHDSEDGSITIPAKLLADVVNGLSNDRIYVTMDDVQQSIKIVSGKFNATIKGISSDEYPVIPSLADASSIELPTAALLNAIQRVAYAAATDDTRPVLTGVLLRLRDGVLTIAAADGFRLAADRIQVDSGASVELIIPARSLQTLAAIATGDTVSLAYTQGQAAFTFDGGTLVTRLIEGKFPDFERIIPERIVANERVIETTDLVRALKLARPFAANSANILKFNANCNTIMLTANAAEIGDNASEVDCTGCEEPIIIAGNLGYFFDAVNACKSSQVSLSLTQPQSPLVLRAVGDDEYVTLVMPLTVR